MYKTGLTGTERSILTISLDIGISILNHTFLKNRKKASELLCDFLNVRKMLTNQTNDREVCCTIGEGANIAQQPTHGGRA